MAFATAGVCLASGSPAQAAVLQCGDTVTASVVLTADVLDCPATALTVGADGVVIDLNGHRVTAAPGNDQAGIDFAGHSRVRLQDGAVEGFAWNVEARGNRNVIRRVVAGGGNTGIRVTGDDNRVADSRQFDNVFGEGVAIIGRRNLVVDNYAAGNDTGVYLLDGSHLPDPVTGGQNRILDSQSVANRNYGFRIVSEPDDVIAGSVALGNRVAGIQLSDTDRTVLTGNRVYDNGDYGAHLLLATDALVQGNRVQGNGFALTNPLGAGIFLQQTVGVVVRGNVAGSVSGQSGRRHGGNQVGIAACCDSQSTRLIGNRAHSNTHSGIEANGVGSTDVIDNAANRNGGDGILASITGGTIADNLAAYNQRNGIHAAGAFTDGGGNRAFGNLGAQCLNLSCP